MGHSSLNVRWPAVAHRVHAEALAAEEWAAGLGGDPAGVAAQAQPPTPTTADACVQAQPPAAAAAGEAAVAAAVAAGTPAEHAVAVQTESLFAKVQRRCWRCGTDDVKVYRRMCTAVDCEWTGVWRLGGGGWLRGGCRGGW